MSTYILQYESISEKERKEMSEYRMHTQFRMESLNVRHDLVQDQTLHKSGSSESNTLRNLSVVAMSTTEAKEYSAEAPASKEAMVEDYVGRARTSNNINYSLIFVTIRRLVTVQGI
ncbi:hypothetical protein Tco_0206579 [Tanacetum coccineum]